MRLFTGGLKPVVNLNSVPEDELCQWLSQKPALNDARHSQVNGGLRFIFDPTNYSGRGEGCVSLRSDTFHSIFSIFNLPKAYAHAMHFERVQAGRYKIKESHAIGYYYVQELNHFVFTHDDRNMTCGYVRVENPNFTIPILLHHLQRSAGLARHPLLLLTVQAEIRSLMMREQVQKVNGLIGAIEKQTGYATLDYLQMESAPRSLTELNLDLSKASQLLGGTIWGLTDLWNFYELIRRWIEQTAEEEETKEILEERLDVVVSKIRGFQNMTTFHEKRAQIQQSTLYNLIAREDSIANIDIARSSRSVALSSQRDSASMKTIAVLTMAFLPATWVAALFAMPLFNWDSAPGEAVLSSHFWVYWALTLPLTVLVLSIWWVWKEWRRRKDTAENEAARNETKQERKKTH